MTAGSRNEEQFEEVERARTPQPDGDIDAEMTGTDPDLFSSSSGLGLHRMSANNSHPFSHGMDDDDEDSSPLHPLMSRLQNRLLSRNTNMNRASSSKFDNLHPYTSILSVADVDQCVELEKSAFPENERCSREKVCLMPSSFVFLSSARQFWSHVCLWDIELHGCF